MARNYSSVSEPKTLTANITDAAATQITLNNVTGLPSAPYVLVLNPDTAKEEVVLVTLDQTGVTSPTLKVTRALETSGGAGVARNDHTIGDVVKHMIVGSDLQIVHDHVDNTTPAHSLNLKAPLASPTFTGNVVLPSTTSIGNVSATEIGYVDGVTSAIQTQINNIRVAGGTPYFGTASGTVTFPAGRFTATPGIAANVTPQARLVYLSSLSSSSFNWNTTDGGAISNLSWVAVQ